MQDSILGVWRDAAIVLLALEIAVLIVVPGAIFFFAIRGVRWVKRRVRTALLNVQVWTLRVQESTARAAGASVALPIAYEAARERVRATAQGLARFIGLDSV